jgi:hypothetical protein
MNLADFTDQPELVVTVAGQELRFSELTLEAKGRLQAWLHRNVPNPVEAIKDDLEGINPEIAFRLLNEARKERKNWPPDIESGAGKIALLSTEPGQIEVLWEGLKTQQPDITRPRAYKIFMALKQESAKVARRGKNGERKIQEIFAAIFGFSLPDEDEEPAFPKDMALSTKSSGPSTGSSSFVVAKRNSG